jgi:3-oxoacyl-[acyl-carrier-protein] synthase-3
MTFTLDAIHFQLGEEIVKVKDLCEVTGRDYERLLKRSGFEIIHRTKKAEVEFFGQFLSTVLNLGTNDFVILVNQSMENTIPGSAPELLLNVSGNDSIGFLEISDGCTGFVRAILTANSVLESNLSKKVHIICAEKYSKYYTDKDESVSPIFSDAISLVTLSQNGPCNILGSKFKNYFSNRGSISVSAEKNTDKKIRMDGGQVLTWASAEVPSLVKELLTENHLVVEDVDSWMIHQGSRIVVETILEKLGVDPKNHFSASNIGNTVSSSIPIAISDNKNKLRGKYLPNGYSVMLGFGVGLSIAATLIEVKN